MWDAVMELPVPTTQRSWCQHVPTAALAEGRQSIAWGNSAGSSLQLSRVAWGLKKKQPVKTTQSLCWERHCEALLHRRDTVKLWDFKSGLGSSNPWACNGRYRRCYLGFNSPSRTAGVLGAFVLSCPSCFTSASRRGSLTILLKCSCPAKSWGKVFGHAAECVSIAVKENIL